MSDKYNHHEVEEYWQRRWAEEGTYNVDLEKAARPFYNLMMFPYPSAEGLHVGNFFAFTGADIYGRYKKAQGYDVFEPMGFDAFGIHSENHALQVGRHPWELIPKNVENFRENQLEKMGAMFDWAHEVNSTDPEYYKWTQWIFLQLLKAGWAYREKGLVNWCVSCKTVLSNEQVSGGICERCGSEITKKELAQWYLKITHFTERLLDGLDHIDWSAVTKTAQRQWIGRSTGAEIEFGFQDRSETLKVFTTRPDTLYGATYLVLAPEHPLVNEITAPDRKQEVDTYVQAALTKSEIERESADREKTGVHTGAYGLHPLTGGEIPIFVSDYVLMGYGTGAIMAVPAHDTRDFEFAVKYELPIVQVISPEGKEQELTEAFVEDGLMINSAEFDGLNNREAGEKITKICEERGTGRSTINYRLRDWGISRQRYWGPPVPVIHCDSCGIVPVPDKDLPVKLPYTDNFKPIGTGESPLAAIPDFVKVECPKCKADARRDCDVMDNFLDSAWYFFRYPSAHDDNQAFDKELIKKWLPVDMYIGGNEHAVLHLMYTRFITMAFHDLGLIDFDEPFKQFRAHGLLIKDGFKMSKSKGNVVNPDEYIDKYGADTLRSYLVFLGPYIEGGDFRDSGINGIRRFFVRLWKLTTETEIVDEPLSDSEELFAVHSTIKKVTQDIERLSYHTSLAALMELSNFLQSREVVKKEAIETLLKLIHPFAPHISHELFKRLGNTTMVADAPWPSFDEAHCAMEEIEFVFLVNGKLRAKAMLPVDVTQEQALETALSLEGVTRHVSAENIKKQIFVPQKLLNLVTG